MPREAVRVHARKLGGGQGSGCPQTTPRVQPWVSRLEVAVLMRAFCRAFGVEAPSLKGLRASEALRTYREFTAACMELAQRSDEVALLLRSRLEDAAYDLGRMVRACVPWPSKARFWLVRMLYSGIGIGVAQVDQDLLRFCPCSFAQRYSPLDCWFMSAFDEGFLRGILGRKGADLVFFCRITQGASCCMARFGATD